MWNFLKFFKKKKKTSMKMDEGKIQSTGKESRQMDKMYDIIVSYYDANGSKKQRPEQGVTASSPQELAALYEACGEKIQILREYQTPSSNEMLPSLEEVNRIPGNNVKLLPMPKIPGVDQNVVQAQLASGQNQNAVQSQSTSSQQIQNPCQTPIPPVQPPKKQEPKYFRINGVDCKIDNGKVFQKQWVKLLGADVANYRLVSEKTNKIIPFTGKILEVLKWIQIEDEFSETTNLIHSIINHEN